MSRRSIPGTKSRRANGPPTAWGAGRFDALTPVWDTWFMALGKTITFRFAEDNATWRELRAFVRLADEMGISDDEKVDLAYEGDGVTEDVHVVGLEAFAHVD